MKIKLKSIIDEVYNSQKYVKITNNLNYLLKELHNSEEYINASIGDSILLENFIMLAEWVTLNNDDLYKYEKSGRAWYYFIDRNNIKHEIRIILGAKEKYEVKLWFIDEKGKPNYSPPNVYNNLKYDTRIFNTYIYILLNNIIPYFFENLSDKTLYLPATDKSRHRLYKITLNNHLDKNKYVLTDMGNNILAVKLKIS